MQWYAQALAKMINKEIDFDSDDIRATLHTSAYTPDRVAHDYVNDLTGELAGSGGYAAGGVALTSKTAVVTAANDWATARANSTAYPVDRVVRSATGNGFLYRCVVAGTSAGAAPTWPTVIGQTVTDGTVTWECVGRAILALDCADLAWATATFTGVRYLVLSDRTPGTAASQPLIAIEDFGTDQAGGGGAFTYQVDAQGFLHFYIP